MTIKTYGTVSAERQRVMSGLEFVKGLASGVLPLLPTPDMLPRRSETTRWAT